MKIERVARVLVTLDHELIRPDNFDEALEDVKGHYFTAKLNDVTISFIEWEEEEETS